MSMTDPIADLLTRVRNANQARKEQVDVPWSGVKEAIVKVIVNEGFLQGYGIVDAGPHRVIRVRLRYDQGNRPVITGLKRVSRPSLRVYSGARKIERVREGLGIHILSTPAGILADREARRRNLGGEVLCAVW